ncbi:sporulation membrane protein YtaF [Nodularia sphaerocarpa]|uniref:sporulation membrane protein YtaF n=1 Tax=Nodularia sphaerocarpa TaxID=137816 RepID=UPI001EFC1924|nr:sporulation membrane protein YtaF [Nodularia sphaerocarpa]MDB9374760.1 sporulation membrane protein YtaF [Nodularia sphaerocarpa CS-585]MDB9378354.1 sporulation membrane protein YtaF [Nodularia sphaerocarpa CS-585A2]ULP70583.1 manganese efflux pump MntP [Nodularia sphaerocarpa UHCC 0038]
MSDLASVLILSIAVSLDSFGVGVTYGMRRISIGFKSLAVITLCTATTLLLAMGLGNAVSHLLPLQWAERLGGVILLGIGAIAVLNNFRSRRQQSIQKRSSFPEPPQTKVKPSRSRWSTWKPLRVILDIWESPIAADFDNSGDITDLEAVALGFSVSLDSFLAGIGAALMGHSIWLTTVIISGMSGCLIYLGLQLGIVLSNNRLLNRLSYLPGILLILLGLSKFV